MGCEDETDAIIDVSRKVYVLEENEGTEACTLPYL